MQRQIDMLKDEDDILKGESNNSAARNTEEEFGSQKT